MYAKTEHIHQEIAYIHDQRQKMLDRLNRDSDLGPLTRQHIMEQRDFMLLRVNELLKALHGV